MSKKKTALYVFVAAAITSVILRIFQLLTAVDFVTGFFHDDSQTTGLLIYVLIAAAIALLLITSIYGKHHNEAAFIKINSQISKRQCSIIGVLLMLTGGTGLYEVFSLFGSGNALAIIGTTLVAASYIFIGFSLCGNGKIKKITGYVMLIHSVYYTISAANLFMNDLIIIRMSEHLILLLSYIAAALFFLAAGRFFSSNDSKTSRIRLTTFGLSAALLQLISTVPRYFVLLFGPAEISVQIELPSMMIFCNALAIIAIITSLYKTNRNLIDLNELEQDYDE